MCALADVFTYPQIEVIDGFQITGSPHVEVWVDGASKHSSFDVAPDESVVAVDSEEGDGVTFYKNDGSGNPDKGSGALVTVFPGRLRSSCHTWMQSDLLTLPSCDACMPP